MNSVFNFSKNYTGYSYAIYYKTGAGNFRRVKGLPVYETHEEAEKASKKYTVEKCYIHRDFVK